MLSQDIQLLLTVAQGTKEVVALEPIDSLFLMYPRYFLTTY